MKSYVHVVSIQGGPPNDQKIVLNRIKACHWD